LSDRDLIGETDPYIFKYVKLELKQNNVSRDKSFGCQVSTKKEYQSESIQFGNEKFWFANKCTTQ